MGDFISRRGFGKGLLLAALCTPVACGDETPEDGPEEAGHASDAGAEGGSGSDAQIEAPAAQR